MQNTCLYLTIHNGEHFLPSSITSTLKFNLDDACESDLNLFLKQINKYMNAFELEGNFLGSAGLTLDCLTETGEFDMDSMKPQAKVIYEWLKAVRAYEETSSHVTIEVQTTVDPTSVFNRHLVAQPAWAANYNFAVV